MPRWVHAFYALLAGYFWLPCPNCGRLFGGHERPGGAIYVGGGVSKMTCSRCAIGWDYGDYRHG